MWKALPSIILPVFVLATIGDGYCKAGGMHSISEGRPSSFSCLYWIIFPADFAYSEIKNKFPSRIIPRSLENQSYSAAWLLIVYQNLCDVR